MLISEETGVSTGQPQVGCNLSEDEVNERKDVVWLSPCWRWTVHLPVMLCCSEGLRNHARNIHEAGAVAPLVVVPGT